MKIYDLKNSNLISVDAASSTENLNQADLWHAIDMHTLRKQANKHKTDMYKKLPILMT